MRVYEAVAKTIAEQGVEDMFGLMGDGNMLYITSFIADNSGRFHPAVDEKNAVAMAGGYAAASDTVGVATVTHGPALTNTVTSLVENVRGHVPVVLVTGDTLAQRDYVQWIDIRAVAALAGAGYERVWSGATAMADTAHAFHRARTERRPLVLDVGCELLGEDARYTSQSILQVQPPRPDEDALDRALGLAVSSNRPLVLAGRGAVRADARDALVALADRLGAPLATSLLAKDYFGSHPLNLGVCGTISSSIASDYISKSDCILAFGVSLNRYTADHGALLQNSPVVQVDVSSSSFGSFTPVACSVLGDARVVAEGMLARLKAADYEQAPHRNGLLAVALATATPYGDYIDQSNAESIDLRTALITLDRILPAQRNLVTDVGRFMPVPWRYMHVDEPMGFLHSVNFASIGLGLGTAIGLATARPDRATVAVLGDGGFMQSSSELRTIVNANLPVVIVVANDGAYGAEWTKLIRYGLDPSYSRLNWPDFADLANACGMPGTTARTVEDLEKLEPVLTNLAGPMLIDLRIDPSVDGGA